MNILLKKILIPAALIFAILIIAKSTTVFMSERYFHKYKQVQAGVRDRGVEVDDAFLILQLSRVNKAMRWEKNNGDIHFEAGRMYHRLSAIKQSRRILHICKRLKIQTTSCKADGFLDKAKSHYQLAIKNNRLADKARFWLLTASISQMLNETEGRDEKDAFKLLDNLDRIVSQGLARPEILRSAGDLAIKLGNEERALAYYKIAFSQSLEGLEDLVVKSRLWEAGAEALFEILPPENFEAFERLSDALIGQWRFGLAQRAWKTAADIDGADSVESASDNLVANGRFVDPIGAHFTGWKMMKRKGVVWDFGSGQKGAWINLDDAPENYFHLTQIIPINPNQKYRFSALVRIDELDFTRAADIGFEVIHPLDVSLWSAIGRCEIVRVKEKAFCKNMEPVGEGLYRIDFEFSPPSPLRAIILRFIGAGGLKSGRVFVDAIRIEPIPFELEDPESE
jgi:tetratricopeptide (TPR) repeat protein